MGRRYSGYGQVTTTASKTQVELRSATTIRPKIYHLMIGSGAAPADNAAELALRRTTTVGTGGFTTFTPQALDPGDPASLATFNVGLWTTTEPTYTGNSDLLHFAFNQRATPQWMAYPGGELILPAAANGAGLFCVAVNAAGFACQYEMYWEE